MIYESYPWKQDLIRRKNLILKYNTSEYFHKNYDHTYVIIEKAIFYSAFIIRKLIDCGGKLSNEADKYSLNVFSIRPLKRIDRLHRWPEDDSHDWHNEKKLSVSGKKLCNSLMHSFLFFIEFNESNVAESFSVSSDYDKNKFLYRVPLHEWIKYINFIATDNIAQLEIRYTSKYDDYILSKKRGKIK